MFLLWKMFDDHMLSKRMNLNPKKLIYETNCIIVNNWSIKILITSLMTKKLCKESNNDKFWLIKFINKIFNVKNTILYNKFSKT